MGQPKRLLIRVDATPETGLGHAARVAAVVEAMGVRPELVIAGEGDALPTLFSGGAIVSSERDLAALASRHKADGILVDLPSYDDVALPAPVAGSPPLILIDDWGGKMQADLIVCSSVRSTSSDYPTMSDPARVLTGPSYCLVRPPFGRTHWRGDAAGGVVVVAGSGLRAQEWLDVLTGPALDRGEWTSLTVVVGATFGGRDTLARQCDRIGATLIVGAGAEALAAAMAGARVALVTGGMTVYECLAVGVPTVVFPQLPNLVQEAAWFSQRDCIENLGFDAGMEPTTVSAAVARLLTDQALAKHMSVRARSMIDGRGAFRVAESITQLLRGVMSQPLQIWF